MELKIKRQVFPAGMPCAFLAMSVFMALCVLRLLTMWTRRIVRQRYMKRRYYTIDCVKISFYPPFHCFSKNRRAVAAARTPGALSPGRANKPARKLHLLPPPARTSCKGCGAYGMHTPANTIMPRATGFSSGQEKIDGIKMHCSRPGVNL